MFNEKGNSEFNNGKNNSDQKIYAYMARMSINDKCLSGNYGDSSQLTNWIFLFGRNVPHDTRGFGFYYRFIRRYR